MLRRNLTEHVRSLRKKLHSSARNIRRSPTRLVAWLPILAFTGCCGLAWALHKTPMLVKVMSFNVRYKNRDDDLHGFGWEQRLPAVADVVLRHSPDIIGTQEGLQQQIGDIQQRLRENGSNYSACGCPRERFLGLIPCGETCAILAHSPAIRCLLQDSFALSETPSQIGSKSWETACPRIATYAWLQVETRALLRTCLLVLNTHLDHRSESARIRGAQLIVDTIQGLETKPPDCEHAGTIITGDFNSLQRSTAGTAESAFAVFEKSGFKDACTESGARNVPFLSFHAWDARRAAAMRCPARLKQHGVSHSHIDWILWRGSRLDVVAFEVDTLIEGCPPSDHFAILATFRIQPMKIAPDRQLQQEHDPSQS